MMTMLRRIAPALVLLVLSPIVAEFLLGDFSIRQIGVALALLPQYGGGALLVREIGRRSRGGWPALIFLALAYSIVEEGFTTQTLFNPNYAGIRLLDYGFMPALGTSLVWTAFVLTLHVVWSVGSCIAIAEGLAGSRWATPWLGRVGLVVTTLLFLLGCALTTAFTLKTWPFVATRWQFASVAVAAVAAVAAALGPVRGSGRRVPGAPPSVWLIGATSLVLSGGFHQMYGYGLGHKLNPALTLAGMLALLIVAIVLLRAWARRDGWGPSQALAAATGAILTYGWIGISRMAAGSTALGAPATRFDLAGQVALLVGVLWMIDTGARRLARVA